MPWQVANARSASSGVDLLLGSLGPFEHGSRLQRLLLDADDDARSGIALFDAEHRESQPNVLVADAERTLDRDDDRRRTTLRPHEHVLHRAKPFAGAAEDLLIDIGVGRVADRYPV